MGKFDWKKVYLLLFLFLIFYLVLLQMK
jgi:hypothetical protein